MQGFLVYTYIINSKCHVTAFTLSNYWHHFALNQLVLSQRCSREHKPTLTNNLDAATLSWKAGDFKSMDLGQSPHNQTQRMGPNTMASNGVEVALEFLLPVTIQNSKV